MRRPSLLSHVLAIGLSHALAPLAALAVPSTALAQTSASETARVTQLFKSGKAAFARNDMAEAERLFAEAFALRKSADVAANLGQSQLEQQKYRAAAEHFQWALVNLLPSASDAQRRAVENGLARSRAEVAVLRLDIKPEGSDVLVGDQNLGKSPISGDVYVNPGEVIVSVKHEGFVAMDRRVIAAKGTEQAVEVALSPRADEIASDAPPAETAPASDQQAGGATQQPTDQGSSPKTLVPAFVATGVAVAGGVVGVVFIASASSKESDADDLRDKLNAFGGCGENGGAPAEECGELSEQRKSVDSSRNVAIGAFVVGGVAALTAGYLYWDALSHRKSSAARALQRRQPSVALVPSFELGRATEGRRAPDSFRLTLSGRF